MRIPPPPHAPAPRWRRLVPLITVMPAIGLILSGLITWLNIGFTADFTTRWMRAFATALPVMPLGILVMLALDRVLSPRLATLHGIVAKVVLAICTACVMELLMASVVTLSNRGFAADFAALWAAAFIKSLPVGVLIGLLMSFFVKPRLDRWTGATTWRTS